MPSFSAELMARLGLDITGFQRGLARVGPSVDQAAKSVRQTFAGTELFRGLLQGIGIGSVQQIAQAFVSPFREAAKNAEDLATATERSLAAMEQMLNLRRSPEEQLAALQRRANALQTNLRDLNDPAAMGFWERTSLRMSTLGVTLPGVGSYVRRRAGNARDQRTTVAANVSADLQENFAAQEKLRADIATRADKAARDLAAAQKTYDEARLRRLAATATAEQKVALAARAVESARAAAAAFAPGSKESLEALAALEARRIDFITVQNSLQQERQQALEKEARLQERLAAIAERAADAQDAIAISRRALAEARGDRFSFTLAEAAAGQRGTGTAQSAAREILRLEEQARRLRDSGAVLEGRTQSGDRTFADYTTFENRALALRNSIRGLVSGERDPLAEQRKAVIESEKHLSAILKELENVSPGS